MQPPNSKRRRHRKQTIGILHEPTVYVPVQVATTCICKTSPSEVVGAQGLAPLHMKDFTCFKQTSVKHFHTTKNVEAVPELPLR